MEGNITKIDDEVIFSHVSTLMERLRSNQKLQQLAEDNGLDIKNSVKLTDDTIDNVAISVIALLLAKRDGDVRYSKLVQTGVQKRSLKTEIVNSYKSQAKQLIEKYKKSSEE
jgi:hypothetical protein